MKHLISHIQNFVLALKKSERRRLLHLGLLTGLAGIMGWLLLAPHPLPFGITIQREMGFVGHVGIFTLVTLACAAAFPHALWWVAATLLVAAVCLEAAQMFIPTRGAEFADVAMNCLGILGGLALFRAAVAVCAGLTRKIMQKS